MREMKPSGIIVAVLLILTIVAVPFAWTQPPPLPDSWSWLAYMPPAKDQGNTPTCIAYAVATVVEAQYRISLSQTIATDEMALYAAAPPSTVYPMDGTVNIPIALNYAFTIGLPSEAKTSTTTCVETRYGTRCTTTTNPTAYYKITAWGYIPTGDLNAIKTRLLLGPLVTWYEAGAGVTHAVAIIGYDSNGWLIQDSVSPYFTTLTYGQELGVFWVEVGGPISTTSMTTSTTTTVTTTSTTTTSTATTTTTTIQCGRWCP